MKNFFKVILTIIFCLYLIILSQSILKHFAIEDITGAFSSGDVGVFWSQPNFIPFKTILYYLFADINLEYRINNLAGNILLFAPFGFLLPLLSKRFQSIKKVAIASFCLSLTFELLQLIFRIGGFDVDDLILNTLGGVLGYLPIKLIQMIKHRKQKIVKAG